MKLSDLRFKSAKEMNDNGTDWLDWLGIDIEESDSVKLITKAKAKHVPIFNTDSSSDIFERLYILRTDQANNRIIMINLILLVIAFVSVITSVFAQ